jgi:hypothetical protein
MPQFTSANAAEMARRSHAPTSARNKPPDPEPEPALLTQTAILTPDPDIQRVYRKLCKLDELMEEAETDRQWDMYSRAYERMFKVWAYLTGKPGPGQLKPSAQRQARTALPDPVIPPQTVAPTLHDIGPDAQKP